jgi:YD repeat-containing protein
LFGDYSPVTALAWSSLHTKHGTVLAFATTAGVWIKTVSGRIVANVDRGQSNVRLSWSPDGNTLARGLPDGSMRTWSAAGSAQLTLQGLSAPPSPGRLTGLRLLLQPETRAYASEMPR